MRALVTGGTAGIGAACVTRMASEDTAVAFTGRDAGRGAEVAARTGATFLQVDVTDRAAADAAVARAAETLGGLDAVVANAGILSRAPLSEIAEDEFRRLLETNLTAQFRTARAAWPHLVAAGGGSIAVIGSDTSLRGSHRCPAYSVLKAGSVMLAEMLAADGAAARDPRERDLPRQHAARHGGRRPVAVAGDGRRHAGHGGGGGGRAWRGWPRRRRRHVSGATIRIDGAVGAALILPSRRR